MSGTMKIQRKLLTTEQRKEVCKANKHGCLRCPLAMNFRDRIYCDNLKVNTIQHIEDTIKEYWNKEIVVNDEIFSNNTNT